MRPRRAPGAAEAAVAMSRIQILLTFLALSSAGFASAAGHPCADVRDAGERLACYDRAFPPVAGAAGQVVDVEAQRAQALRDFGLNREQLREKDPARMRELAPGRIEAGVVRVSTTAEGKRVVTLDNGQTWLLTENTSRGDIRSGHRVVVREAALGTFMLVTQGGIALRARRTR
ncbi:hypothetical protein [Lysobacter humi (ex Lee et al. 2017)]